MTLHPAAHRGSTAVPTPDRHALQAALIALVRRLVSSTSRCQSRHYDAFLARTVRCRLAAPHGEVHRFRTLDETVLWH